MATAQLNIEFLAGTTINDAWDEAIRLCRLLGVKVKFNFNGVSCHAYSTSITKYGVEAYNEALRSNDSHKTAFASKK